VTEGGLRDRVQVRGAFWILFVLLVLAGASRWIVTEAHPEAEPTLASLAVGCAWATLVSLSLLRRSPAQVAVRRSWTGVVAGALLFGGPAIGALIRARGLDGPALTMALALTPVVVGIAAAAMGLGSLDGAAGRIWPGLAAVGGLLLIVVEPSLADPRRDVALVLAPVMTGLGAAMFCLRGSVTRWRATTGLLGGTLIFSIAVAVDSMLTHVRPTVSLLAVSCDGLLALLSVYALQRVGATRWSAQFTLLPLLIAVEGIVLTRPPLTLRSIVGVGLLALASVYLLLPPTEDADAITGVIPR
jgi:drug/metabolite transporter (DMT)-like permease